MSSTRLASLGFGLAVLTFSCSRSVDLTPTRVMVIDGTSAVVRQIEHDEPLAEFEALWLDREAVTLDVSPRWRFKVDIESKDGARARWLYDPTGYARALAANDTPTFRFRQPEKLGTLLGIPPASQLRE